jgi:hypothetical protein
MLEKFSLWFDHEISETEHHFHLGFSCSEPNILVFEMLRILIVKFWKFFMFRTSYACIRRKFDNLNFEVCSEPALFCF